VLFAEEGSGIVGDLLAIGWELDGGHIGERAFEIFKAEYLAGQEGEPVIVEFQLKLAVLLAASSINEWAKTLQDVSRAATEFALPSELASASYTGTYRSGWCKS
jgi:hypothetical protein